VAKPPPPSWNLFPLSASVLRATLVLSAERGQGGEALEAPSKQNSGASGLEERR
jgi:hypothetical protein